MIALMMRLCAALVLMPAACRWSHLLPCHVRGFDIGDNTTCDGDVLMENLHRQLPQHQNFVGVSDFDFAGSPAILLGMAADSCG